MSDQKPKVYGVIPARYQSQRFEGKMLHPILGKPLVQWTYESAKDHHCFDELYVATDDARIYKACQAFNAPVFMTDPKHPNGTSRIVELISTLDPGDEAIIINLQGDEPCVSGSTHEALINALIKDPECPLATPVFPLSDQEKIQSPSCVKCLVDQNGYALYFSRSVVPHSKKIEDGLYLGHLGLYAYRWHFLKNYQTLEDTPLYLHEDLEQLKALEHGYRIKVVEASEEEGLGVNEKEDIPALEAYLCKQNIS